MTKQLLPCPNNWVSVKDRLPEREEYVLVYNEDDKKIYIALWGCDLFDNGICKNWHTLPEEEYGQSNIESNHIKYWQPLPEPPETYKIFRINIGEQE